MFIREKNGKDAKLQNLIAEQKLRTQRVLGKLIKEGQEKGDLQKHGGARNFKLGKPELEKSKTLKDIGLSPDNSSDFQTLSNMPEEEFEKEIKTAKEEK